MIRMLASLMIVFPVLAGHAFAQSSAGKAEAPAQAASKAAPKPAVIVNLNTATQQELETLPGIGAKTAERIIDYRQKKGPFKKIEELMNVQGVGEKSFLKLKPQITVATKTDANQ